MNRITSITSTCGIKSRRSSSHAAWFKGLLGPSYAITREDDPGIKEMTARSQYRTSWINICFISQHTELLRSHSTDWIRRWEPARGEESWMLLRPANTKQVAAVIKYCHDNNIGVVPQGGNTGLVGGSTPVNGNKEVILSLSRLNRVIKVDEDEGILECEAGCTLETLR